MYVTGVMIKKHNSLPAKQSLDHGQGLDIKVHVHIGEILTINAAGNFTAFGEGIMKRYKGFAFSLMISIALVGCTNLDEYRRISEDTRLSNLAYDDLLKRDYQQAEKYLEEALALNPNNPYALLNMGVVYQRTGRIPEARIMYMKVIAHNPEVLAVKASSEKSSGQSLADIAAKNLRNLPAGALK